MVTSDSTNHNPWSVTLQLNSVPVEFHNDTGAEVTVINETVYQKVGGPSLCKSDQILRGPSNNSLPVNPLTRKNLQIQKLGFRTLFKYCAFACACNFNASDGYLPVYTRIIHTNLQTMINKQ